MDNLTTDVRMSWNLSLALLTMLLVVLSSATFLVLGQVILAPILLSIVVGLMFGPVADKIERWGVPPSISGLIIVILFSVALLGTLTAIILPLSGWTAKLPLLWQRLQQMFADWEGALSALNGVRERIDTLTLTQQNADMVVQLDEGSPIKSVVTIAPKVVAQNLMFLASLYFFVATRKQIKASTVSLFISQQAGYCGGRIFRDVERMVSKYLISISIINLGVGICVSTALWAMGIPGALMWGMLAALLNYITFVGPALMLTTLFAVGLMSFESSTLALLPAGVYLAINFFESQFISPMVIGKAMTLNPFLVFLSITFWIWAWGPLGGFVAVPSLIIAKGVLGNFNRFAKKYQDTVPLNRNELALQTL
ncbi:AI-2E family transporter [Maritalea sp.]|uniref:AI-2E family transporter n=1 Tax=Maritalea sp. TaxID=2003361 RepID=UPI003EF9C4EA